MEEMIIAELRKPLTGGWTRKNLPPGFVSNYQKVAKLPPNDTESIFLRIGFKAWLAYFLCTYSKAKHFDGKAAQVSAIENLHTLSVKSREEIATALLRTSTHQTVEMKIPVLESQCRNNRRRKPSSRQSRSRIMVSQPLQQALPMAENLDARSTMIPLERSDDITTEPVVPVPQEPVNGQTAPFGSSEQEIVTGPLNTRLPILFPQYVCGVIRKAGERASLWMVFKFDLGLPCILSFSVLSNRLEHFAMRLFGAHIETDGGFRYVVLKDGLKLHPRPSVALQGVGPELLRQVCGPDLSLAIDRSPVRRVEINQAIVPTACLSLEISNIVGEDGVLSFSIAEVDGYAIKKILFE